MKRREALEKTTWVLYGAVFGPGLMGTMYSCQQKISSEQSRLFLDNHQFQLTKSLADTLLPKTTSPAASEVRIPELLDLMMNEVFSEEVNDHLTKGLDLFDEACKSALGNSFVDLDSQEKMKYLAPIDQVVMSNSYESKVPFYFTFKQLVITLYYSTEQGVKQNLDYRPIPGAFDGDILMGSVDKIMIGNKIRTYEP